MVDLVQATHKLAILSLFTKSELQAMMIGIEI